MIPDTPVTDWIDQALAAAGPLPCVVIVDETAEVNLRWANNSLTTNGQMHDRSITVHVFAPAKGGTAVGSMSAPLTSSTDIEALVGRASASAAAGEPSPDAMDLVSLGVDEGYANPAARTSIAVLADVAVGLGELFATFGAARDALFGFAEHRLTTTWVATSAGARRRHVQPMGRLEINAKRPSTGASAWVGQSTGTFTDIDLNGHAAELRRRLDWGNTTIELPPGRYETLLPPGAVADLILNAYWVMSAKDAAEGRTVWARTGDTATRLGEKVSPFPIALRSDPARAGLEQAPFAIVHTSVSGQVSVFDNATPVDARDWIRDGALTDLFRTRRYAEGTGADFAYPVGNLILDAGGTASLDEMIARTERGLLLTCLWYIREVDPETLLVTGLTRDGVYLIEDGQVVGAVNNFRFNESPVDLLGRITEIGASEQTLCREWNDWFTHTRMPPIRVPDFHMSTVSQAS
ncbi:metallopeptidase TldD-related protein [Granulicoccus sp. GXG6511]|uniref:metallopeptidase TldD-related protein n=1 Tax=Granulicoccus sp. GXG6511 TaxID=3381351 RepID=UPI003D7EF35C